VLKAVSHNGVLSPAPKISSRDRETIDRGAKMLYWNRFVNTIYLFSHYILACSQDRGEGGKSDTQKVPHMLSALNGESSLGSWK